MQISKHVPHRLSVFNTLIILETVQFFLQSSILDSAHRWMARLHTSISMRRWCKALFRNTSFQTEYCIVWGTMANEDKYSHFMKYF